MLSRFGSFIWTFPPRSWTPGTVFPLGAAGATSKAGSPFAITSSAFSRPSLEMSSRKPPFSIVSPSPPPSPGSLARAAMTRNIPTSRASASVATLNRLTAAIRPPSPQVERKGDLNVAAGRRRLPPESGGRLLPICRQVNWAERLFGADAVRHEAVLEGVARGFGAVRDPELAIDVRQVELDRLLGDPELFRDRLVRQAPRDGPQDHQLALGQSRFLRGRLAGVTGDADRREHRPLDRLAQCRR